MDTVIRDTGFRIFSGSSSVVLAKKICHHLGVSLGRVKLGRFSDGEIQIEVLDNLSGLDIFVIQSTCPPVDGNLLELLLLVDAIKRESTSSITAIIPYYGYARQDRKTAYGVPISAKLVADLLTTAGVTKIVTVDIHSGQIQGFFNIPVDNVYAMSVMYEYISSTFSSNEIVIVSPDAGGVSRARLLAKNLGCGLAIIDKYRPVSNKAVAVSIVGDVTNKIAIIQDDMVDTAGTLTEAVRTLHKFGVSGVHVCCTHPILSGPAVDRIAKSPIISLVVTDTIPLANDKHIKCDKIKVLSVSKLLSEAISKSFA